MIAANKWLMRRSGCSSSGCYSGRPQGAQDSKTRFQQAQRSATGTQQPQGIASGWLHQFNVLLQRAWLYKIRDEMVVITQVTMACIMALLLGAIYFQQGLSQASIQSSGRGHLVQYVTDEFHRL